MVPNPPVPERRILARMRRFRAAAAALVLALTPVPGGVPAAAAGQPPPPIDPVELIRRVVKSQRRLEAVFEGATYDQREVRIDRDGAGRTKDVESRLYYVLAGEGGRPGSRELVEVNGRPATDEEKRKAAEADEKARKRFAERAAARAKTIPKVDGDEDDPLVGSHRLSELIDRYTIRLVGEEVIEGRPAYVLEFSPSPTAPPPKGLGDRALNGLEGRAVIDAASFQVRSVEARLTKPVKVAGGLAANVKSGDVSYESQPASDFWFPCTVDLRIAGRTALFFRLDSSFRVEFANLRRFRVETESDVRREPDAGGDR